MYSLWARAVLQCIWPSWVLIYFACENLKLLLTYLFSNLSNFDFQRPLKVKSAFLNLAPPQYYCFQNFQNGRDKRIKTEECKRERERNNFKFDFELKHNQESLRWERDTQVPGSGQPCCVMIFKAQVGLQQREGVRVPVRRAQQPLGWVSDFEESRSLTNRN